MPPEPQRLTQHNDPVSAMLCADILEGDLPPGHRDLPGDNDPGPYPFGIEFERKLTAAKREGWGESLV